ncbi:Ubiquitin-conjugating enzyme/RWD-like [Phytophthora cactorum]|nr:Ubiquitin-conjugating enzyme/RWD-like [Phytophthora cactorum]
MASAMATKRLRKEYLALQRNPVENIRAAPLEKNILEWHYVITGTEGTPYEGGFYHGKLKFPPEYPMKPPSVIMCTPNGRFEINRRICLSMSDFHPETWNPLWAVGSILTGLYSFMLEDKLTTGGVLTTEEAKRTFAAVSLKYNCKDKNFRTLFADLVELQSTFSVEVAAMASVMATKRLRKEYLAMQRKPVDYIQAVPLETNILEWHYVITGTKGTPYEGGFYHGKLKFPPEYPMKPPSVMMITPNGRFKTNQRLCLSMSDFHPETWNPMWSVSSILTGLYSFMLENQATLGSISTSDAQKRKYAAASLESNCTNATFRKLFPDLQYQGYGAENAVAIEDWSTTVYLIGSVLMVATFAAYWLS